MNEIYVFTSVVYTADENKLETTNEVFKSKDKAVQELERFQKHFESFTNKDYEKSYSIKESNLLGYQNKCDNGDIYRWEIRRFFAEEIL